MENGDSGEQQRIYLSAYLSTHPLIHLSICACISDSDLFHS